MPFSAGCDSRSDILASSSRFSVSDLAESWIEYETATLISIEVVPVLH